MRFRGNIEKVLGRGHLKRGLVAIVLRPTKSSRALPAGLVTEGSGFLTRELRLKNGKLIAVPDSSERDVAARARRTWA